MHQLRAQPRQACPVGSPSGLITPRAILSQPVFPTGALGEGGSLHTPGAPTEPGLFPLPQNPHTDAWKSHSLVEVASYCEESRGNNQWVPYISLQER